MLQALNRGAGGSRTLVQTRNRNPDYMLSIFRFSCNQVGKMHLTVCKAPEFRLLPETPEQTTPEIYDTSNTTDNQRIRCEMDSSNFMPKPD